MRPVLKPALNPASRPREGEPAAKPLLSDLLKFLCGVMPGAGVLILVTAELLRGAVMVAAGISVLLTGVVTVRNGALAPD
jgi:hypothetical protein